jgi:hypothetical protein
MVQIELGRYEHYKGAKYEVLQVARHSETEQWHVVYRQCYGDEGVWIRPLEMFMQQVTLKDGTEVPRFAKIK